MRQIILSDEDFANLAQALEKYDSLEAEQPADALWSVEEHAELQHICGKLISAIRPHIAPTVDEAV